MEGEICDMNNYKPKREGGEHNIFTKNDKTLELFTVLSLFVSWILFKIFFYLSMLGLG